MSMKYWKFFPKKNRVGLFFPKCRLSTVETQSIEERIMATKLKSDQTSCSASLEKVKIVVADIVLVPPHLVKVFFFSFLFVSFIFFHGLVCDHIRIETFEHVHRAQLRGQVNKVDRLGKRLGRKHHREAHSFVVWGVRRFVHGNTQFDVGTPDGCFSLRSNRLG